MSLPALAQPVTNPHHRVSDQNFDRPMITEPADHRRSASAPE